jgi:hypothetical protein
MHVAWVYKLDVECGANLVGYYYVIWNAVLIPY